MLVLRSELHRMVIHQQEIEPVAEKKKLYRPKFRSLVQGDLGERDFPHKYVFRKLGKNNVAAYYRFLQNSSVSLREL